MIRHRPRFKVKFNTVSASDAAKDPFAQSEWWDLEVPTEDFGRDFVEFLRKRGHRASMYREGWYSEEIVPE